MPDRTIAAQTSETFVTMMTERMAALAHTLRPFGCGTLGAHAVPSQHHLPALLVFNHRPGLVPTVITNGVAQRQERIDVRVGPVHARPFQSIFDHQFVGTFHHAAADRPPVSHQLGILHLRNPRFQIGQRLGQHSVARLARDHLAYARQHRRWARLFERAAQCDVLSWAEQWAVRS